MPKLSENTLDIAKLIENCTKCLKVATRRKISKRLFLKRVSCQREEEKTCDEHTPSPPLLHQAWPHLLRGGRCVSGYKPCGLHDLCLFMLDSEGSSRTLVPSIVSIGGGGGGGINSDEVISLATLG